MNNTMASIGSKKREAGKLRKRCLTLDEKIKILDKVKKSKMSSREIEHFKIGKTQAANVVKNKVTLRAEYENFRGKGFRHHKRENHQKNTKISIQFCTNGVKNVKLLEFILVVHYSKKKR